MSAYCDYSAWSRQAGEQPAEKVELRHGHGSLRIGRAARRFRKSAFELLAALVQVALQALGIEGPQGVEQHLGHLKVGARSDAVGVHVHSPFAAWWAARQGDAESGARGNGGAA